MVINFQVHFSPLKFLSNGWLPITLYSILSPLLTWLNKGVLQILTTHPNIYKTHDITLGLSALYLTFLQQTSSVLILNIASYLLSFKHTLIDTSHKKKDDDNDLSHNHEVYHQNFFCFEKYLKFFLSYPSFFMACCFVLQLTLCNLSLRESPLTSYQAVRSSTLVFSVLIQYFFFKENISYTTLLWCIIIGTGFILAVFDSAQTFSWISIVSGLIASLAGVIYMALCRTYVKFRSTLSKIDLAIHIASFSALLLFLSLLCLSDSFTSIFLIQKNLITLRDLFYLLFTIILAPIISLTTLFALQNVSPLSCTISGFAKGSLQAILGNILFHDPITPRSILGVCLCLFGCAGYSCWSQT